MIQTIFKAPLFDFIFVWKEHCHDTSNKYADYNNNQCQFQQKKKTMQILAIRSIPRLFFYFGRPFKAIS